MKSGYAKIQLFADAVSDADVFAYQIPFRHRRK
jgi:hypothetical protein